MAAIYALGFLDPVLFLAWRDNPFRSAICRFLLGLLRFLIGGRRYVFWLGRWSNVKYVSGG
jgi:hypothetical protein